MKRYQVIKELALILALVLYTIIVRPSFYHLLLLLLVTQYTRYTIQHKTRGKPREVFQTGIVTAVVVWVLYWLNSYSTAYGVVGFFVLGVLISIYIIIRQWRTFINTIEDIERKHLYGGKTASELRKERKVKNT